MSLLQQIASVTALNLAGLRNRKAGAAVIVLGMAAVVGVTISVLSLSLGLMHSADSYLRADRVIVLSGSAQFENQSRLSRAAVQKIVDAPGVKKDAEGKPLGAAEMLTFYPGVFKGTRLETGLPVRGTNLQMFAFRPEFKLREGRLFTPGLREVIVGAESQAQLTGVAVGDRILLQDGPWTVVGSYESGGAADWGMFADAETLLSALRRNDFTSVNAALETPESLGAFKAALAADPTLNVVAERETDYWRRVNAQQDGFYKLIAYGLGGIMGVGALFAALNIMYATIGARMLEIATLRAIGFAPAAVMASVFAEALLLAGFGAGLGVAVAWGAFNGRHYDAAHFNLLIDGSLALLGAVIAVGIGALAALLPALRAARMPVAVALQGR